MSVKQLAKRAIDALGYEVRHRVKSKVVGGKHYGPVRPVASYSPWLDNADFSAIFDLIKPNTLVDRFRCYELWELVSQVGHLPGNLLEVGVWRGGTAALICRRAKELAKKPTVYLCDTFTGVCKATDKDSSYSGGEHADTSEQVVRDLLRDLGCENFKILTGIFPEDHLEALKNETFCFVHIDVDVYESAKDVFNFVWPRMPVGGMAVFDDFGFDTCDGIPILVAEYQGNRDKLVIQNLNGHAIIVKTA
jgi:O-methyltransferase